MISYEMREGAVVIKENFQEIILDIPNLRQTIANIKASRETYATEEAYEAYLAMYQKALLFAENSA